MEIKNAGVPWWHEEFDERQVQEIRFAQIYAKQFAHGTSGHHRLLIIAKLVEMLELERVRRD